MKKLLFLLFLPIFLMGQAKYVLPLIIESTGGRPIANATVTLYTAGTTTPLVATLTWLDGGRYYWTGGETTVPQGNYDVYVTANGLTSLHASYIAINYDATASTRIAAMFVLDTAFLKLADIDEGANCYLKQLSSTNTYGGGLYTAIDSTYPESYAGGAYDHPTAGLQWVEEAILRTNEINVLSFGADPTATDTCSTEFQNAIDFAKKSNIKNVFAPQGNYFVKNIQLADSMVLRGAGRDLTMLQSCSTNDTIIQSPGGANSSCFIKDIAFDGLNGTLRAKYGIYIMGKNVTEGTCDYGWIRNCYFQEFARTAVGDTAYAIYSPAYNTTQSGAITFTFEDNWFQNCDVAIRNDNGNGCRYVNNKFTRARITFLQTSGTGITIIGNGTENNNASWPNAGFSDFIFGIDDDTPTIFSGLLLGNYSEGTPTTNTHFIKIHDSTDVRLTIRNSNFGSIYMDSLIYHTGPPSDYSSITIENSLMTTDSSVAMSEVIILPALYPQKFHFSFKNCIWYSLRLKSTPSIFIPEVQINGTELPNYTFTKFGYGNQLTSHQAFFNNVWFGDDVYVDTTLTADTIDVRIITSDTTEIADLLNVSGTAVMDTADVRIVHSDTVEVEDLLDTSNGYVLSDSIDARITHVDTSEVADLLDANGFVDIEDSLGLGSGTNIWKIIKSGTDLLFITAADTFVVDSVRAK